MSYSPWGSIDRTENLTPGVAIVSTPRHGGVRVSKNFALANLSKHARKAAIEESSCYWYEEDADWAIVAFECPDLRPQFYQYSSTPPCDWESDLRKTLTFWNLPYALAAGIVTVDALPERYYCPKFCERAGLEFIAGDRNTPGRVACKCGHVIYEVAA